MAWNRRRRGTSSSAWAFIAHNPWLAVLFVAGVGVLAVSRGRDDLFDGARGVADDAGGWVMEYVSVPAAEFKRWGQGFGSFLSTYEENERLRSENAKLRVSLSELAELQRKVQRFEVLLKIPADAAVTTTAARVIADTSGPFVRTVLVNAGKMQSVEKGQAVVDDRGLLGRIIGTGNRSSRVLLLSDLNSRIPVIVEGENLKAILVGDNSDMPTLEYLPSGTRIAAGARVVTTSDGAAFPPGIAIGTIIKGESAPRVQLYTSEGRADFVRVLSYHAPVDVDDGNGETDPGAKPSVPASDPHGLKPGSKPPGLMHIP